MFISTLKQLLDLLSQQERRRAYLLLGMVLLMAIFDTVGIASVMPLLSVLANPEVVKTNRYLAMAYQELGFTEPGTFIYFLGVVVFVLLVVSIVFKALTTYTILWFTHMRNYSLSRRLVVGYLRQPYEWFLNRHSADLGKTVLSEVEKVIQGAMIPMIQLIAQGTVAVALVILLLIVNPWLAIISATALGGAYGLIYILLRKYLLRIGADRVAANKERFAVVQEAFGGIKDIKIGGLEIETLKRFDRPSERYARQQAISQVASYLPRYLLEIIAFGGMLLVILYLMRDTKGLQKALPLIGLFAFAGYRLLPALQQVYTQLANLRFSKPALEMLHTDFQELKSKEDGDEAYLPSEPMGLLNSVRLEQVTYQYPGAEHPSLKNLSLEIQPNTTVGIVGSSGSGKTTTVDLILGLLIPGSGNLLVDETVIDYRNVRAWQRSIGYVPQQIFLSDASVAANIAFGLPDTLIDMVAVKNAARIANLHDFIVADMPSGYETAVGERGIRLSGGQRQRIGIARALYHDPELLIFDEATSALDNVTEQAVMDAIHKLAHKKTIIVIAHRLSTIISCDEIYLLANGQVRGQGTYEELLAKNEHFRAMVQGHS